MKFVIIARNGESSRLHHMYVVAPTPREAATKLLKALHKEERNSRPQDRQGFNIEKGRPLHIKGNKGRSFEIIHLPYEELR